MALKLLTAPTSEPVTLAEAKAHLRIDSQSLAENIDTQISIAAGDHVVAAAYSLVGSAVEVSGYNAVANLNSGPNGTGGTVDVKLQESQDNTTWSDVSAGAFTQVTESNDNAIQEKAYTGSYRYIRALATVAVATCDFAVTVVRSAGPTVEDNLLNDLITAARQDCEVFQNRSYFTTVWELWLDAFPAKSYIDLPRPPLQVPIVTAGSFVTDTVYRILTVGTTDFTLIGASANTVGLVFTATGAGSGTGTATASGIIKYYGTDDTEYSMSGADLFVDVKSEPGRISLDYGISWPSTTLRPVNGVCVQFVAGYSAVASIPRTWKQAILLLLGHLYENREAVTTSGAQNSVLPLGVEHLLWKDRMVEF